MNISNPLGEDFSVMRTTSLNGMLTSLATNYNRRNKNVRLYELANVYRPSHCLSQSFLTSVCSSPWECTGTAISSP